MQIWPFRRKPKPRVVKKDVIASKLPAVLERQNQKPTLRKKLFGRFSRKSDSQQSRKTDFGQSYREQRNRRQQQQQLQKVAGPIMSRVRVGMRMSTIFIAIIVVVVVGTVIYLNNKQVYLVKDIVVTGNKQISQQEILDELNYIHGKSMFSFSESGVESELTVKFPYIKVAQVRKQLPGKLTVEIEERYPVMAYINLAGVFLVDDERIVVSHLGLHDADSLTTDELLVASGFGDPNANYVYEHYLSKIEDEDERKNVKWDEVPIDDKKASLQEYRDSLMLRVDSSLNNNLTALLGTEFTQLPRSYGYDSQVYDIGSSFSDYIFNDSGAVQAYLLKENLTYTKMTWQSEFTMVVELDSGMRLLFSSTRNIQDQLTALNTVRSQGDLSGATQIDLRSDIVAVK